MSKIAPWNRVGTGSPLSALDPLVRTLIRSEFERAPVAGAQLPYLAADGDAHGRALALAMRRQRQLLVGEAHEDRGPLTLHRERQPVEVVGDPRLEVQYAVADVRARVASLDEVERLGHDTHVDALFGGIALDVADVALQGDEEPLPRAVRI